MPAYTVLSSLHKNQPYFQWLTLSKNQVGVDFEQLVAALHHNTTVRKVSCHANFMAHLSRTEIAQLMSACAALPKLNELWVALPPNRTHLSSQIVTIVFQRNNNSLQKITLKGFDDCGCIAMARELATTATLTQVHLLQGSNDDDDGSQMCHLGVLAMAEMLRDNKSLQQLVLSYNGSLSAVDGLVLADALKANRTLQRLDLRRTGRQAGDDQSNDNNNQRTNQTTNSAELSGNEALLDLLRSRENDTLQVLETDAPTSMQSKIQFHAKLNFSGVPHVLRLEHARVNHWVNVLSNVVENRTITNKRNKNGDNKQEQTEKDDLSILFYALRSNPEYLLCYNPDYSLPPSTETTTFKLRRNSLPHAPLNRARSAPSLVATAQQRLWASWHALEEPTDVPHPRSQRSSITFKPKPAKPTLDGGIPLCCAMNFPTSSG